MRAVDALAEDTLDDGVGLVLDVCNLVEADLFDFGGDGVGTGAADVLAEDAADEHADGDA